MDTIFAETYYEVARKSGPAAAIRLLQRDIGSSGELSLSRSSRGSWSAGIDDINGLGYAAPLIGVGHSSRDALEDLLMHLCDPDESREGKGLIVNGKVVTVVPPEAGATPIGPMRSALRDMNKRIKSVFHCTN